MFDNPEVIPVSKGQFHHGRAEKKLFSLLALIKGSHRQQGLDKTMGGALAESRCLARSLIPISRV